MGEPLVERLAHKILRHSSDYEPCQRSPTDAKAAEPSVNRPRHASRQSACTDHGARPLPASTPEDTNRGARGPSRMAPLVGRHQHRSRAAPGVLAHTATRIRQPSLPHGPGQRGPLAIAHASGVASRPERWADRSRHQRNATTRWRRRLHPHGAKRRFRMTKRPSSPWCLG